MLTEQERKWTITLWKSAWSYEEIASNIVWERHADEQKALAEEIGELCKSEKNKREKRQ